MAKFEALMENKTNPDTQTEQSKPQSRDLSDQELAQASGGNGGDQNGLRKTYGDVDVWKWDSQGRATHLKDVTTGTIYHYTCPRCGRILHFGTWLCLYCDPCDEWWWSEDKVNKVIDEEGRRR